MPSRTDAMIPTPAVSSPAALADQRTLLGSLEPPRGRQAKPAIANMAAARAVSCDFTSSASGEKRGHTRLPGTGIQPHGAAERLQVTRTLGW